MNKTNSELLELLTYYDELTTKQADCIAQMSRMIARQARTIAMLQGDNADTIEYENIAEIISDHQEP